MAASLLQTILYPKERISNTLNSQLCVGRFSLPLRFLLVWFCLSGPQGSGWHQNTSPQWAKWHVWPGPFSQSKVLLRGWRELLPDSSPPLTLGYSGEVPLASDHIPLSESPSPCLLFLTNFCPPFSQKGSLLWSLKGRKKPLKSLKRNSF